MQFTDKVNDKQNEIRSQTNDSYTINGENNVFNNTPAFVDDNQLYSNQPQQTNVSIFAYII